VELQASGIRREPRVPSLGPARSPNQASSLWISTHENSLGRRGRELVSLVLRRRERSGLRSPPPLAPATCQNRQAATMLLAGAHTALGTAPRFGYNDERTFV
jgi:hypothetical protein